MLLLELNSPVFNLEEIKRGGVVYAKKDVWDEGICGIITEATEDQIRIQYLPDIHNVINHCVIRASQVAAGIWELRYSVDGLVTVHKFPEGQEDTGEE